MKEHDVSHLLPRLVPEKSTVFFLLAGCLSTATCRSADCPEIPLPECGPEIAAGRWNLIPAPGTIQITGTETDQGALVTDAGLDGMIDWTVDGSLAQEWLGGGDENYVDVSCDGTLAGKGHDRITGEIRKSMVEATYCEDGEFIGGNPVETHMIVLERTYDIVGRVLDAGTMELTLTFTSGSLEMTGDLGDWVDCRGIKGVFVADANISLEGESETLEVSGDFDPLQPVSVVMHPKESEALWLHQFLSKHLYENIQGTGHPGQWNPGLPGQFGPFLQLDGPEVEWLNTPQMENVSPVVLLLETRSPQYYLNEVDAQNEIVATVDWRSAPEPHEVEFDYDGEKTVVAAVGNSATTFLDMGRPGETVTAVARAGGLESPVYPLPVYKVPVPGWAAPVSGFSGTPGIRYETTLDWPVSLETTRTLDTLSILTGLWGIQGSATSELVSRSHSNGSGTEGDFNTEVSLKLAGRTFSLRMEGPNTSTLDCETLMMEGEASVMLPPAEWEATLNPLTLLPGLQPAVAAVPGFIGDALSGIVNGFGIKTSASVALAGTAGYESRDTDIQWVSGGLEGTIEAGVGIVVIPPPIDRVLSASVEGTATGCLGFEVAPEFLLNKLGGSFEVAGQFGVLGMSIFNGSEEWPFGDPCGVGARLLSAAGIQTDIARPFVNASLGPDGRAAVAWSEVPDGQSLPSGDIVVSIFDGSAWGGPIRITDDIQSDLSPVLAFDGSGGLLICYQRNPSPQLPAGLGDLPTFAQGLEIVFAAINPSDGSVKSTGLITENDAFDFGPTLRTDSNGLVHLFWQRTDGESLTGTAEHPAAILARVWDGNRWLDEEIAADGLAGVFGWHPAAHSESEAIVGIVRDVNGDLADSADREVYFTQKSGGVWQSVVRLTDNTVEDGAVLAGFDQGGAPVMGWRQGAAVVGLFGDFSAGPEIWFPDDIEVGPGFALGHIFANELGIGLVWPEANNLVVSATFGGEALPGGDWRPPEKVADSTESNGVFDAGFSGDETFTYTFVKSGSGAPDPGSDLVMASRSVLPQFPNRSPVANPDLVILRPGQAVQIEFADLLSNDRDPDGHPLRILDVDATSLLGAAVSVEGETIRYGAPVSDGEDMFTYRIADGRGGYAEAVVTVQVVEEPVEPTGFMFTRIWIDAERRARFETSAGVESYVVVYRGDTVDKIDEPVAAVFGAEDVTELMDARTVEEWPNGFYLARSIPLSEPLDHDGDGIDDTVELVFPTVLNPFDPSDAEADGDADGVPNSTEIAEGTNPALEDSDGDGIDDRYERDHPLILDPLDPYDAGNDPDGDNLSTLVEYRQGSDPEVPEQIEPSSDVPFYPGRLVETGLAGSARLGDVNGDGRLDAVAPGGSFGAANLQAALGNSDGGFDAPVESPLGNVPVLDWELFELNGDDYADVVIVADPVLILLGDGTGLFNDGGSHSTGSIRNVAAGDITGDGMSDLFLFSNFGKSVTILENDGAGGFSEMDTLVFESPPLFAAAARLNDDAFPDLVLTLQNSQVVVLPGGEAGLLQPRFFPGGASAERFGTGDINGDGFTDVVTANKSRDDISILLANGDGTFGAETRIATGDTPRDVKVADVNGDGLADLLVSHSGSQFHVLLRGDGFGGFSEPERLWSTSGSDRVVLVDFDGDGHDDLIGQAGASLVSLSGSGDGTFETRGGIELSNASVGDVQLADLDGDGDEELLLLNTGTGTIDVWEHGYAEGEQGLLFSLEVPARLQAFVVMDQDGDMAPDIVALSVEPQFFGTGVNQLALFRNQGGAFSNVAEIPLDAAFTSIFAIHLDDDPLIDLLATVRNDDPSTSENEVQAAPLLNQGDGGFVAAAPLMPGLQITGVIARDLDGDGRDEAIMNGFFEAAALAVFARESDGEWTKRQQFDLSLSDMLFADIDEDGTDELVVARRSPSTGETIVEASRVEGGVLMAMEPLFLPHSSADQLAFADVNGDGLDDILLGNLGVHLARAGNDWEPEPDRYHTGGLNLRTADLNRDGKPDIVSWGGNSVGFLIHR